MRQFIPQPEPFLLPPCHDILVLPHMAALASPGHPALAARRTIWRFLPANSFLESDISTSSQPPSLPPLHPCHPSCCSQLPAGETQSKHLPTCSHGPARETAEAIITHLAQQNDAARGRGGLKQLEIIHGERCSHPQCLGLCLTPNQPGLYRECAPWALCGHPECQS